MSPEGSTAVTTAGVVLWAPESFTLASEEQRKKVCNGCGPGSWKHDIVPDHLLWVNIGMACNIHDWMYEEGTEIEAKEKADRVFLNNMLRLVMGNSRSKILKAIRCRFAWRYFTAVSRYGGPAFWSAERPRP